MSSPNSPLPPAVEGLNAEKLLTGALHGTPVSSPAFGWEPPSTQEVAPWFPEYEVLSLAGRGAMGAVYQAVQRKFDRPVAIKLLPAELAARDGVAARFEREARAMARLNHPGIVALYDYGRTEGGHLFIVMEFVEGADLSRLIHAEGGVSVPQALGIVTQVCDALQYAHSRGFVHRDIKPGNVLVDTDGRVKIADFGLAKLLGDDVSQSSATMTGTVLGTPDYTAPEQLKGGAVDHRADIYSLGVMFYEMLTGDLPRGAWEPPSKRVPAANTRLDEVVTRAMQSEPDKRYQQASEVKTAVEEAAGESPSSKVQGGRRKLSSKELMLWLVLAGGAVAGFLVCYVFEGYRNSPAETRFLQAMKIVCASVAGICGSILATRLLGGAGPEAASRSRQEVRSPFLTNGVFFWLMTLLAISSPWLSPTGDILTILMLAGPFIALAIFFRMKRQPVGAASAFVAGMAACAALILGNSTIRRKHAEGNSINPLAAISTEKITPDHNGRVLDIKVTSGQKVVPGTVVAAMDASPFKLELEGLKRQVLADRMIGIRDYDQEIARLESDLRAIQTTGAEDSAIMKTLEEISAKKSIGATDPVLRQVLENSPGTDMQRNKVELAKAKGRSALSAQHLSEVTEGIRRAKAGREALSKEADLLTTLDFSGDEVAAITTALRPGEQQKFFELKTKIDHCHLKTIRGGTVARLEKQSGDYVTVGESVLTIAAE